MRTAQELFDESVNFLRKQGKKATLVPGVLGTCFYRTTTGCKCAVGYLIPDEEYKPEMEGKGIFGLLHHNLLTPERAAEFENNKRLLTALQSIHDNSDIIKCETNWKTEAEREGLEYKEP